MLTESRREELKKIIEEEIRGLETQIANLRQKVRPIAPDCSLGRRLTRLEALGEKQVNETVLRESELRLIRLRNTLPRIGHEEFGLCIECGEPIPHERLKIRPDTLRCVECAE